MKIIFNNNSNNFFKQLTLVNPPIFKKVLAPISKIKINVTNGNSIYRVFYGHFKVRYMAKKGILRDIKK